MEMKVEMILKFLKYDNYVRYYNQKLFFMFIYVLCDFVENFVLKEVYFIIDYLF